MALTLHRRRLGNRVLGQVEITAYAPLGCRELIRLVIILSGHTATLRSGPDDGWTGLSKAVVTTHGCLRTPLRRPRCDRRQAGNIAVGDRALRLRKGLCERITVSSQILLQSGMDYVGGATALDFGDQPKRRMIVLVDATRLGAVKAG